MEVQGWLKANGTAAEPILFTRTNGGWQGIYFNYSPPVSQLSFCIIERGVNSGVRIVGTTVSISDCTIQNNSASGYQGGGLNSDSDLVLTRCMVSGNTSGASGGGVRCEGALTLNGCTVVSNQVASSSVAYGGGVSTGGALALNGCTIARNSLSGTDTYGAGAASGAGITAVDSVIVDNRAQAYRGNWSANCYGAGLYSSANANLEACQLLRNSASATTPGWGPVNYGGGIYCGGTLSAANVLISSNAISTDSNPGPSPSWARGGGIYTGALIATNLIINHNSSYAVARGSSDQYGESRGAGIYVYASLTSRVVNCTIAFNSATAAGYRPMPQGGGILSGASASNMLQVANCIVWGNSPDQLYGLMAATYSDVQNGFPGQGNVQFNPIFTAPAAGDFHLLDGSPCIDAGNPDTVFNDACFPPSFGPPQGYTVRNDMGAYGGPGACDPTQCDAPTIASQPQGQSSCLGQGATFCVTASGTPPLSYQWWFNGNPLPGQTTNCLVLANLQTSNAGAYSVVVSSACGSITSAPAQLVVNDACVDICTYAGLNIAGLPGRTYELRYTTDLNNTNFATWTFLATNTTPWFYIDTTSCGVLKRFYGVRLRP